MIKRLSFLVILCILIIAFRGGNTISVGGAPPVAGGASPSVSPSALPSVVAVPPSVVATAPTVIATVPTSPAITTIGTTVTKTPWIIPPTNTIPSDLTVMRFLASQINYMEPSWSVSGDPCLSKSWAGVSCNAAGYIISINLNNTNLNVPVETFSNISSLSQLQDINLSGCGLAGVLPIEWGSLGYLKVMDLSNNPLLTGQWPETWNYVAFPNLNEYNTTLTGVLDSWAYFCPPPPSQNSYYNATCLGRGSTHMSKTLINVPTFLPCTSGAVPAGTYVTSLCQTGSYSQLGSDRQTTPCTSPGPGQYSTQVCIPGSDTSIGLDSAVATCSIPSTPEPGFYVLPCVSGSANSTGTNTTLVPCSQPVLGVSYTTKQCFYGEPSSNIPGINTVLANCDTSAVQTGSYIISRCEPGSPNVIGSNRVTAVCSIPTNSQFTLSPCFTGTTITNGTNTVIEACTPPTSGFYVTGLCVTGTASQAGSNTVTSACANTTAAQVVVTPCVPGSIRALGVPAVIEIVKAPGSTVSQYVIYGSIGALGCFLLVAYFVAMYLRHKTTPESRAAFFNSMFRRGGNSDRSVAATAAVVPKERNANSGQQSLQISEAVTDIESQHGHESEIQSAERSPAPPAAPIRTRNRKDFTVGREPVVAAPTGPVMKPQRRSYVVKKRADSQDIATAEV